MRRRLLVLLACGLGTTLLLPQLAAAAQRYASPTGGGTSCSAQQPCKLTQAVSGASLHDEVIVAPGDYPLTTQLDDPADITIHGVAGKPRPRLQASLSTDQALRLDDGSTVRYLEIDDDAASALFLGSSAAADQLIVRGTGASDILATVQNSALTNSLVATSAANAVSVVTESSGATNTSYYRNVTAIATGTGATAVRARAAGTPSQPGHVTINAVNVVARAPHGTPLRAETNSGGSTSARIVATTSNYPSLSRSGLNATVTSPGTGGNQTAAPLFVDEAGADFHQAPGSPTIDAGTNNRANGAYDFDGDFRTIAGHTDIGADERPLPPIVNTGAPLALTPTSATLSGTINPGGTATAYHFDYGTTAAYGHSTPTATLAASSTSQSVSAAVSGLTKSTQYHFRLVASNAAGAGSGDDVAFTTPEKPFAGVRILSRKAKVRTGRASIRLRCPADAAGPTPGSQGTCAGTLVLRTAKKVDTSLIASRKRRIGLGRKSFSIAAGATRAVRIRISKKGRRLLSKLGKLRARALVSAHDGRGASKVTRRKLKLRLG